MILEVWPLSKFMIYRAYPKSLLIVIEIASEKLEGVGSKKGNKRGKGRSIFWLVA